MAEEVARHTAETAIRQMQDTQSIKLSIQSQEAILEEDKDSDRCQVCPAEEDPVEAAESTPQTEPREAASPDIEPEPQEEPEPQRASPSPHSSPEPERFKTVEPEPKLKAQGAKVAPEPVTQQPQKAEYCNKPNTTTKEEWKTVEEGDCVPASCDAVKSCLMRIPHAPVCLNSFNNLLKEYITAPKLPPMPQLPTNLSQFTSQVTQLMPSLPPELSQEFFQYSRPFTQMSQRVSQLPQQISQLPQQMSQLPHQLQV
ncbi:eukaryotic translation initiation factor 5B-like [Oncorhynchus tshawytscha]|uniref:eukaryotic translation initiation factor 5B-like n=1 Tax=Oncorhynchus tshawytscha TaxID=74940 RepID=UPI001C3D0459|nr:eukaryotic translation initiation factor 5B-like [Oncorhynchus tshawytscha]